MHFQYVHKWHERKNSKHNEVFFVFASNIPIHSYFTSASFAISVHLCMFHKLFLNISIFNLSPAFVVCTISKSSKTSIEFSGNTNSSALNASDNRPELCTEQIITGYHLFCSLVTFHLSSRNLFLEKHLLKAACILLKD